MSKAQAKNYIPSLEVIAGIAIIEVLLIHMRIQHIAQNYTIPYPFVHYSLADKIVELLTRYAVPTFVFVAGFKFELDKKKHIQDEHFQLVKYVRVRIRRLIVPYLIWSFIFLVISIAYNLARNTLRPASPPDELIAPSTWIGILTGYYNIGYQLWFLPMLFVVSIFVIFCREILKRPEISYIIFIGDILFQAVSPHTPYLPWEGWLTYLLNFELGIIFATLYIRGDKRIFSHWIWVSWLVISFVRLLNLNPQVDTLLGATSLVITPLTLFVVAMRYPVSDKNWLYRLGIYSWPIFLLHAPFLLGWLVIGMSKVHIYNFWTIFPGGAVVLLLSLFVYWVIQKINRRLLTILF